MSDLPSWARPGVKVVCLVDFGPDKCLPWERMPAEGKIYTIATVQVDADAIYLTFKELRNVPWFYDDGFGCPVFVSKHFRPLVEDTDDNEIEARLYRHKQLHLPLSKRLETAS